MPHQTPDNPADTADTGCPVAAAAAVQRLIRQRRAELAQLTRQRRAQLLTARAAGHHVATLAAGLGLTKGRISQLTPRTEKAA